MAHHISIVPARYKLNFLLISAKIQHDDNIFVHVHRYNGDAHVPNMKITQISC